MRLVISKWRQSGHAHGHGHGQANRSTGDASEAPSEVRVSVPARIAVFTLLGLMAIATVLGLTVLWPDHERASEHAGSLLYATPEASFERGEVIALADGCETLYSQGADGMEEPAAAADDAERNATSGEGVGAVADGGSTSCTLVTVGLLSGPDAGRLVELPVRGENAAATLRQGDEVELIAHPTPELPDAAAPGADQEVSSLGAGQQLTLHYELSGIFRGMPLMLLAIAFVVAVGIVGRVRGLLAIVALGLSAVVLGLFVLPAIVAGGSGLAIGIVGASAIMFVTLYLVHGPSLRTTAALLGTLVGILLIALISLVAVSATRLTGVADEASGLLGATGSGIDLRGLLSCAILIAGLGVLNDVTITQASAVWELRAAAPSMSRAEVFTSAMRIGRDHIASTVYTVFFAYAGSALSVLLVISLYDRPLLSLLTHEDIATEIVRTLCGSIGLVLAVPLTTWVAVLLLPVASEAAVQRGQAARVAQPSPVARPGQAARKANTR